MDNMNRLEDVVWSILFTVPDARNSDNILYSLVIEEYNKGISQVSISDFFRHFADFNLPRIESVGRARRKLQEAYPELRGEEHIKAWRRANERAFREYGKEKR